MFYTGMTYPKMFNDLHYTPSNTFCINPTARPKQQ